MVGETHRHLGCSTDSYLCLLCHDCRASLSGYGPLTELIHPLLEGDHQCGVCWELLFFPFAVVGEKVQVLAHSFMHHHAVLCQMVDTRKYNYYLYRLHA